MTSETGNKLIGSMLTVPRALLALALLAPAAEAFVAPSGYAPRPLRASSLGRAASQSAASPLSGVSMMAGPRPLHTDGKFTVEKATPELLKELDVENWPTWSTKGSPKYVVGKKSPLKVYDCNELSYIIEGKMEIESQKTGEKVLVQAGDFVTFPDEFPCYWHVIEEINKHWFCYDKDGNPDR